MSDARAFLSTQIGTSAGMRQFTGQLERAVFAYAAKQNVSSADVAAVTQAIRADADAIVNAITERARAAGKQAA